MRYSPDLLSKNLFGKGVYFADMVSKSANYCVTSKTNPTGLMPICDVALISRWSMVSRFRWARVLR